MNVLELFAGAGGGILGSRLLGHRTVCAVEIYPYCREILLRRQEEGHLEPFPVWDDVRTFDGQPWRGVVDVVSAGFPCQPFSAAGDQRGECDDRNMWPDTMRIIREVRPRFAFLENVPGLLSFDYFGQILGDLATAGFDARWEVVSAAEVGAPHIRKRLWILAHANGLELESEGSTERGPPAEGLPGPIANANGERKYASAVDAEMAGAPEPSTNTQRARLEIVGVEHSISKLKTTERSSRAWPAEPNVGRVADELAGQLVIPGGAGS